ncbi:MAG TPA: hypothetical protein VL051_13175 [Burkholderiaceae bacterium]|nr:hypothetical protein [Burkholderiaceae bacterium]
MAITDRNLTGTYRNPAMDNSAALRRPFFSSLRWGAILAGVVVGVALQMVLTMLGVATGLSTLEVGAAESASATGPLLWAGISMLIAAFVGGYVAARASGLKRKSDGLLHGATAWGVTTLLFVVLAASAGGSMLGGIFGTMGEAMTQSNNGAAGGVLSRQFGNVDPGIVDRFERQIQAGNRNDAIQLLTGSLNMDPQRAAAIVDQALIVAGSPEQASPQGRAAANRTVQMASSTAWMVFGAMALSLALGMSGGLLGASGARRMVWDGSAAPQAA